MRVTYIHHSCFLVETGSRYYLFDWYQGELPELNPAKPILVLASHNHHDHYDSAIFEILARQGMTATAVLAKDIPPFRHPAGIPVLRVKPDQEYPLEDGTLIRTLRSTDQGVAFLIDEPEGTIYHAGDLNDWYWEGEPEADNRRMTKAYRERIDRIGSADIAFVVLDPRQEAHYADGMLYFLEHTGCDHVFPMHYWGEPEIIGQFELEYPQYQHRIHATEQTKGSEIVCSSK